MQRLLIHLQKPANIAPLVVFRIVFGIMVFYSTFRFMVNGWVKDLYIEPSFYFTYYGFDWVQPLPLIGMYTLFILMLIAALGIALGSFYKLSTITFFLIFTYVELLDKTNYLNHYYFVSLISFLLILVPAGKSFSLDVYFKRKARISEVPNWTISIFKFQLIIVYCFAGLAKLNYHWLFEAQPLFNWLKHQTDLPLIGPLFKFNSTAYIFAWSGALFDLCIPFILLSPKWRSYGYILVVFFHLLTAIMFPIGVFPYVMIGTTLIFFSSSFHQKSLAKLTSVPPFKIQSDKKKCPNWQATKTTKLIIIGYVFIQLLVPFRYLLYPGKLFWTEQGYRFSWRVMLIEKAGYAEFYVKDEKYDGELLVNNSDYLTPKQEKMMATQPDMILQYAHFLRDQFKDSIFYEHGAEFSLSNPIVTVNSQVTLFNEGTRTFIKPHVNLANQKRGWMSKTYIEPYE